MIQLRREHLLWRADRFGPAADVLQARSAAVYTTARYWLERLEEDTRDGWPTVNTRRFALDAQAQAAALSYSARILLETESSNQWLDAEP